MSAGGGDGVSCKIGGRWRVDGKLTGPEVGETVRVYSIDVAH